MSVPYVAIFRSKPFSVKALPKFISFWARPACGLRA